MKRLVLQEVPRSTNVQVPLHGRDWEARVEFGKAVQACSHKMAAPGEQAGQGSALSFLLSSSFGWRTGLLPEKSLSGSHPPFSETRGGAGLRKMPVLNLSCIFAEWIRIKSLAVHNPFSGQFRTKVEGF